MAQAVQDFWTVVSLGLLGYDMSRTQSIMRIATTASPVSGSDVRERMAALELASTRLNAIKTMQRKVKFWRQYTRIKKGISNSRENSKSASESASPLSFRSAAAAAAPAPSSAETGQLQRPPPRPRSSSMLNAFASLSENGGTPAVADLAADLTSPTLAQSLTPAAAPSPTPVAVHLPSVHEQQRRPSIDGQMQAAVKAEEEAAAAATLQAVKRGQAARKEAEVKKKSTVSSSLPRDAAAVETRGPTPLEKALSRVGAEPVRAAPSVRCRDRTPWQNQ